jgi:hypothetical protein
MFGSSKHWISSFTTSSDKQLTMDRGLNLINPLLPSTSKVQTYSVNSSQHLQAIEITLWSEVDIIIGIPRVAGVSLFQFLSHKESL